jgi:predicted nucleic acid-binding protein
MPIGTRPGERTSILLRTMAIEIALDASVAAKWQLADEDHVPAAAALLDEIARGAYRVIVPAIWKFEVCSILSRAAHSGRLHHSDVEAALQALLGIPTAERAWPTPADALRASLEFRWALYDAMYLQLAGDRGCDFWTDDRRMISALAGGCPFVRWIGDFERPNGS